MKYISVFLVYLSISQAELMFLVQLLETPAQVGQMCWAEADDEDDDDDGTMGPQPRARGLNAPASRHDAQLTVNAHGVITDASRSHVHLRLHGNDGHAEGQQVVPDAAHRTLRVLLLTWMKFDKKWQKITERAQAEALSGS